MLWAPPHLMDSYSRTPQGSDQHPYATWEPDECLPDDLDATWRPNILYINDYKCIYIYIYIMIYEHYIQYKIYSISKEKEMSFSIRFRKTSLRTSVGR